MSCIGVVLARVEAELGASEPFGFVGRDDAPQRDQVGSAVGGERTSHGSLPLPGGPTDKTSPRGPGCGRSSGKLAAPCSAPRPTSGQSKSDQRDRAPSLPHGESASHVLPCWLEAGVSPRLFHSERAGYCRAQSRGPSPGGPLSLPAPPPPPRTFLRLTDPDTFCSLTSRCQAPEGTSHSSHVGLQAELSAPDPQGEQPSTVSERCGRVPALFHLVGELRLHPPLPENRATERGHWLFTDKKSNNYRLK